MKTIKNLNGKVLLEKGLKLSYEKSWDRLFPNLKAEVEISLSFVIIGCIIALIMNHQKAQDFLILIVWLVCLFLLIFAAFKLYKLNSWKNAKIDKTHLDKIIGSFEKEIKEINNEIIKLSSDTSEKIEIELEICYQESKLNPLQDELSKLTTLKDIFYGSPKLKV